jgi:hypothetical protein
MDNNTITGGGEQRLYGPETTCGYKLLGEFIVPIFDDEFLINIHPSFNLVRFSEDGSGQVIGTDLIFTLPKFANWGTSTLQSSK